MTQTSSIHGSTATSVPYATAVPRHGSKVWAGVGILFGGVCLILLGGCFLIGVLAIVQSSVFIGSANSAPSTMSGPQTVLMVILYMLAFASFIGAAALIWTGVRALLRVMRT